MYECDKCHAKYSHPISFKKHCISCTGDTRKADFYRIDENKTDNVDEDENDLDSKTNYKCPRCNYSSYDKRHYIIHLQRKQICVDTNNCNIEPTTILDDLQMQYNNKKFECDKCHSKYDYENTLKRHYKTCQGVAKISNNYKVNYNLCEHNTSKRSCKKCGTGLCQSEACSVYENIDKPFAAYTHEGLKLCINCYNHIALGGKQKKMVRKEQFVLAELQRQLPELESFFVLWDCPIEGGCSNKRPDMLYDFGIGSLVIEIDEDAHKAEDPSCREKRMCQIYEDLAERPIIFIRFNPDKYENRSKMFRMTPKSGQLKCNETEFEYRMEKLVEEVKKVYNMYVIDQEIPDKLFNVKYLFM
jgi:hypothetical protein